MKKILAILGIGLILGAATVFAAGAVFPDVEKGSYYEDPVYLMNALGVINGYDNGDFGPGDFLNRAQTATIIARYHSNVVVPLQEKLNELSACMTECDVDEVEIVTAGEKGEEVVEPVEPVEPVAPDSTPAHTCDFYDGTCIQSSLSCTADGGILVDGACDEATPFCCVSAVEPVEAVTSCDGTCVESELNCAAPSTIEHGTNCSAEAPVCCMPEVVADACEGNCMESGAGCLAAGNIAVYDEVCEEGYPVCCYDETRSAPAVTTCTGVCLSDLQGCNALSGVAVLNTDCTDDGPVCCVTE